jgi:quinohemoprotein ethanol dehydrogenase
VLGLLAFPLCALSQQTVGRTVDWASHNNNNENAYSPLVQIDTTNVRKVSLVWHLDLPDEEMLQATPLEVHGVLYFTGSHATVYAVDAVTGNLRWTYDPQTWKHNPAKLRMVLPANRGVGYADGRVFVGTLDGRLIALDAKSGKLLWSVETTSPQSLQFITGAPRTFKGKVIIGNGGADFGARGYVTAYDAASGHQVWRFYVVPGSPEENRGDPAMERAAATWNGEYWKTGTGGGPWDSITFDSELNRIYVGTGNAAPYDPEARSPGGGDNLYTASIVALDADTGAYMWHYQVNPRDAWDYDSSEQMTLADLVIDGRERKVLMQAPKNGFFYVLDRQTGKVISAAKVGKVTWAERIDLESGRPVEAENIRFQHGPITLWPAPNGAHNWQSMSFSPKSGLVYIPYLQMGMHYEKTQVSKAGTLSFAGLAMTKVESDPGDGKGALVAWDPVEQRSRWKVQRDHLWNGGILTTAGNLVFQGTAEGLLAAYDAYSGECLWRFDAGLGITAAPISYAVRGRQYLSVLVGYGGTNMLGDVLNAGWKFGAQPRRLLTFALDGKAVLPPSPRPDIVHPLDDPSLQLDDVEISRGRAQFTAHCALCHGLDVISAGAPAPDLRESRIALDREAMWQVVHQGALLARGMPRFDDLDAVQIGQIYSYIRAAARQSLSGGQASLTPR